MMVSFYDSFGRVRAGWLQAATRQRSEPEIGRAPSVLLPRLLSVTVLGPTGFVGRHGEDLIEEQELPAQRLSVASYAAVARAVGIPLC